MKSFPKPVRIALSSLAGGVLGFLILHPYTTLIYGLYKRPGDLFRAGHERVFNELAASFRPDILHMGVPFAFLGAAAGLFFGFWLEARRQRIEMEKQVLAVETLRQLMMTISHHMLNAAQIVGGFAARDIRKEQDDGIRNHLEAIRNEAVRIEAMVESLKSIESVKGDRFSGNRGASMLDIQKEFLIKTEEWKRKQL